MNNNSKWSVLKLAVLFTAVSVLLTGCFIWRDHDRDRGESSRHEQREEHHDQEHHDSDEHH
jgi:hypothetical protein